ncbi:MAG: type I-E CRISPR-associated protein Cse1/CasA [Paracoccus sp. (in: a-proteobacteria)]|uniref:type I-E CRISPR-associated protein Cse1/CasA n=1 Tax=Paracoccus sp. TaxID=267 RepID=UPI0026E069BE|nr:type I-E CRISPR-associated protein Cse1/CasA [Paracoccus sp. (in: a-proteobacteria)]MDO5632327.1 type I-E CRISPR-associated protein Cse1/CasA [Paracoccus sp. (in: a-proteobacteria)]
MPLNLITDPWIPVVTDAGHRTVAPWEIADCAILRTDWPRADMNIACLELLVGLVAMADPPADDNDWLDRWSPDPDRLRQRLEPFAPAFNLTGVGPRFMQDFDDLPGEPNPVDMLFIDSAGGQTVKNNADLMVWRGRYGELTPAMAAMALYTFQAFAPAGGAGNRTSMRGGGPMVTLVEPQGGLWPLIWANTPCGQAAVPADLPWMRKTTTSEKAQQVFPEQRHPVEAFFGMPRRLRLVGDEAIAGVVQRPYGTNYAGWDHPTSPYYRVKAGAEWLPKHPRAGLFGYRHWLGVIAALPDDGQGLARRAAMVEAWERRAQGQRARVIVAGWAMDNMKPRDFVLSTPPLIRLEGAAQAMLAGLIEAAEQLSLALRGALAPVLAEGELREAAREEFYTRTQTGFETALAALEAGIAAPDVAQGWLAVMRAVAFDLFDARALPGLADRDVKAQQAVVQARGFLAGAFAGRGKYGKAAFGAMELPLHNTKQEAA